MKKLLISLIIFFQISISFSQSVGIGTNNPNTSAILDINSNNKGVLFPKVLLLDNLDNTTIPNAAPNLLVFNINTSLPGGKGLYYNKGTVFPKWEKVGELNLPFSGTTASNDPAIEIDNTGVSSSSTAIQGYSTNGAGIKGISANGPGVLAYSGSGNALEVSGKIKIAGLGQAPAIGKVLTSDANGNATWQSAAAVAFSSRGILPSEADFENGITHKVVYNTVDYDIGADYTPSPTSTFTTPYNGIYHFDAAILWSGSPNVYSHLLLVKRVNGVDYYLVNSISDTNGATWSRTALSIDVKLIVGDQVFVKLYHNSIAGGTETLTTGGDNYFNGHLIVKL